ncbi:MAG TPA: chemotaxis protein CheA [Bacteroidetes bacterium]|jgi:two-component system, chemotaxis family, sensor kinase CheA|nr:chemotaxis protein CheA [Bacteroidota bacterium]
MSDQQGQTDTTGFDNEMTEILESFIVETREIMERLGQELLELEKRPMDSELHNSIFRAVHTIKGTSSFLGFEQLTTLAHRCEDVLNKIRKKELTVTSKGMDILVEAYDLLKALLQMIEDKSAEKLDLTNILAKLEVMARGVASESVEVPTVQAPTVEGEYSPAVEPVGEQGAKPQPPEPVSAQSSSSPTAHAKVVDSTIRVDVTRLDSLMNLVGELVLGRNRLSQIAFQLGEQYEGVTATKDLVETSSQIDFITTELQMAVMKTRMVPIAKVFNKLPRLIRDLCKEMGKEIDLQVSGEETELDKSIIEELNDPLVHIIRNAADHGVELPEERKKNGKSEKGTVIVKAEHVGNHIVISILDDGKGMDPEKLKQKGIEKGLITEAQAREMSRREAFNLIFAPGFSTAAKVTNVSGRGVGMDVVRTNISKLKGIVEIESETGIGSTFVIKLPLTLAIIQGLLVEASNEIFSIPLGSVLEVVRARQAEIATVNGHEVIRLRNTVLPLARIADVLGSTAGAAADEWRYIVVVGLAERRLGVVVDSLLGQKEVVIKSLGDYLGKVPGIAGSTILGDGRVIMIVDVGEFMKLCSGGVGQMTRPMSLEMAAA